MREKWLYRKPKRAYYNTKRYVKIGKTILKAINFYFSKKNQSTMFKSPYLRNESDFTE